MYKLKTRPLLIALKHQYHQEALAEEAMASSHSGPGDENCIQNTISTQVIRQASGKLNIQARNRKLVPAKTEGLPVHQHITTSSNTHTPNTQVELGMRIGHVCRLYGCRVLGIGIDCGCWMRWRCTGVPSILSVANPRILHQRVQITV